MAKWTIYKLVDGEEQYVNQSDNDLLTYTFPRNETTSDDIYVIKYKNGDIEESVQHRVVTGSCATIPSKCSCDNIVMDNQPIYLEYRKGSKFSKTCYCTNGCLPFFKIKYTGTEEWLKVTYKEAEGLIFFEALSEATDLRQATVEVYYDADRTPEHQCESYSFDVSQMAKTSYNVLYEVSVIGIEKFQLKDVKILVEGNIRKTINLTGKNGTSNGHTSGYTTVNASSIDEAMSKLRWFVDDSTISYSHMGTHLLLKKVSESQYGEVRYEASYHEHDMIDESMFCKDQPSDRKVCACGQYTIMEGGVSPRRAISLPSNTQYDIIMNYIIKSGICRGI